MKRNNKLTMYTMHVNTVLMGIGFYMLLPLLSVYFYNTKMFTAVMVGYVMSSRAVSYDISGIFCGSLGDIVGCKKTMIAGCLARCVCFLMFGFCDSLFMYIIAGALCGIGGALFLPACAAYYDMMSTDENRAQMYTLQNMLDSSGNIFGPTLGTILMAAWNFQVMCTVCAIIYIISIIITILFLPELKNEENRHKGVAGNVVGNIVHCAKDTQFLILLFSTLGISFMALQRDLCMPVKLSEINPTYAVGIMYTVASLIAVAVQMPLNTFLKKRMSYWNIYCVSTVSYCLGLGFVGFARNIPSLYIGMVFYSLGLAIFAPVKASQMAEFAGRGRVASYSGFQGLVAVIVSLVGNLIAGKLYDIAKEMTGLMHYLPYYVIFAIAAFTIIILQVVNRKRAKAAA